MDKQDELAAAICVARLGIDIAPLSVIEPDDVDLRTAAAVRTYLDGRVDEVRQAIQPYLYRADCKLSGTDVARLALSAAGGGNGE